MPLPVSNMPTANTSTCQRSRRSCVCLLRASVLAWKWKAAMNQVMTDDYVQAHRHTRTHIHKHMQHVNKLQLASAQSYSAFCPGRAFLQLVHSTAAHVQEWSWRGQNCCTNSIWQLPELDWYSLLRNERCVKNKLTSRYDLLSVHVHWYLAKTQLHMWCLDISSKNLSSAPTLWLIGQKTNRTNWWNPTHIITDFSLKSIVTSSVHCCKEIRVVAPAMCRFRHPPLYKKASPQSQSSFTSYTV